MHSTHAHRLPPGTSENHWKSLCFCMPPPNADLINSIKTLSIHRDPYKTSKNEGFRIVAGGPRQHGCRAGHAHERRAGRVSPCRLEGNGKKGSYQLWLDFSRFLAHQVHGFSVNAILHCGPRDLAGGSRNVQNNLIIDWKTYQKMT